ncbi:MAG TPA: glycoside hydrolase family 20 zincin-like fold domain-containing protein, partial [Bacteroidales bacterium]|nr:glycoside hydrolase family 20 zincin-like fold domain-containing protein [Bacteroidales bacterium]
MQNVILSVLIGMVLISGCQSQTGTTTKHPIAIIPAPLSVTQMKGSYSFTDRSRIIVSPLNAETRVAADFLAQMISNSSGMDISVTDGSGDARASVYMSLDSSVKNAEGYYIKIDRRSVTVRAAT